VRVLQRDISGMLAIQLPAFESRLVRVSNPADVDFRCLNDSSVCSSDPRRPQMLSPADGFAMSARLRSDDVADLQPRL